MYLILVLCLWLYRLCWWSQKLVLLGSNRYFQRCWEDHQDCLGFQNTKTVSSFTQQWGHLPECGSLTNYQSAYYHGMQCCYELQQRRAVSCRSLKMADGQRQYYCHFIFRIHVVHNCCFSHILTIYYICKTTFIHIYIYLFYYLFVFLCPPPPPSISCLLPPSVMFSNPMAGECKQARGLKQC